MSRGSRTARAGRALRETLLWMAAAGGAICIVLTILAFTGGYSLIMFATGSMSPTIPAGSVALVQRIDASEVEIGDVVTIDRPGALPVTHRVTGVFEGTTEDQRLVTMRGDANDVDDPAPYPVADVRIVRGSLPHLAAVVVWFGSPVVLGCLTVSAAAVVTWAFWPRQQRRQDAAPSSASAEVEQKPPSRRERRAAGALGAALIITATAWQAGTSVPAHAATDALELTSGLSGTQRLDDSEAVDWDLDVDASDAASDGQLTVALSGSDATAGMRIVAEVRSCEMSWTDAGCASGESLLRPSSLVSLDGSWDQLLQMPTPARVHLRIALTAPNVELASASASLTVRTDAVGERAEASLDGAHELAPTGGPSWAIYAAPAAVLVGLGTAMVARSRRGGET